MNNTYNDQQNAVSYLEFGAIGIDPALKKIYDFRTEQQAYDWFMHSRYSQDIACYLWMIEALNANDTVQAGHLYQKMMHHRDDFSSQLSKWAALHSTEAPSVFYEHGQTLFGCIEGIEFCDLLLRKTGVLRPKDTLSPNQVHWEGFDISPFFNLMAKRLHECYSVATHSDISCIPNRVSTVFAKGVTLLYALRSTEDFFTLFKRASCGVFDISLAVNGENNLILGTGKHVCYLSLKDFKAHYQKSDCTILVRSTCSGMRDDGTRLYLEGVICQDAKKAAQFTQTDSSFRTALVECYPELCQQLLPFNGPEYLLWSEFNSFLDACSA